MRISCDWKETYDNCLYFERINIEVVQCHRNKYKVSSNMNSMTICEYFKKLELLDYHCEQVAISNMLRISEDIKYNSENSY